MEDSSEMEGGRQAGGITEGLIKNGRVLWIGSSVWDYVGYRHFLQQQIRLYRVYVNGVMKGMGIIMGVVVDRGSMILLRNEQ